MPTSYAFSVSVEVHSVPEQSDAKDALFAFAYTILIENVGKVPAQLISRHWLITHADGKREEVKGLGVVGQQPLLKPGEAFEYTSGCRLSTPTGTMEGAYFFVAEDGHRFEVPIAPFQLCIEAPNLPSSLGPKGPRVLH